MKRETTNGVGEDEEVVAGKERKRKLRVGKNWVSAPKIRTQASVSV